MKPFRWMIVAAALAAALLAWQSAMASLEWTEQDKWTIARRFFTDDQLSVLPGTYNLKKPVKLAWGLKGAADRTRLMNELARAAKDFVMTPAFEKTYDQWIKESYSAVNHGIRVDDQGELQRRMQAEPLMNSRVKIAAITAGSLLQVPPDSLKYIFTSDMKQWGSSSDPKQKALHQRGKAIEPLLQSNPTEFRNQYVILKSISMGGPDNLPAIQAAMGEMQQSQNQGKLRQEQRAYDKYKLRVQLKKRLEDFIALARTVDFSAQTQMRGNLIVFVNPAYEKKPRAWKQMFRLGREPVMAAVAFAEQWQREL